VLGWGLFALALGALIVVPFLLWEEALVEQSRVWLAVPGARALVAVACVALLASDIALPVPSSFVAAGAVASLGPFLGAATVWVGLSLGAALGYAIGRGGGRPVAARLVGDGELARAERLMERYGAAVLVVCRGVPVLAEASVLLAGAARLGILRFAAVTGASNLGLALAYALLSRAFGGEVVSFVLPFALGILVPALAIGVVQLAERR